VVAGNFDVKVKVRGKHEIADLFIARKIIEINGGTITVESQPGKGSRFEIEL